MGKINNFTKTLSLRAKVTNTYGARLYSLLVKLPYSQMNTFSKLTSVYSLLVKLPHSQIRVWARAGGTSPGAPHDVGPESDEYF